MDCKNFEILVSRYLENEVSRDLYDEISRHLKVCSRCRNLKEKVESNLNVLPELEEDIPFYLKNRLYYIPESEEVMVSKRVYFKWVAAIVGTIVLFMNLFYFTNIFPSANRTLHLFVSKIEILAVETVAFFEKIKDSKGNLLSVFEKSTKEEKIDKNEKNNKGEENG